jgi:putative transposase
VKGRKRHVLVDTEGLLLDVVVSAADLQDRDGAQRLLAHGSARLPALRHIWADQGYRGVLEAWALLLHGWTLEIVRSPRQRPGFQPVARRWVVERTFAWLGRWRRLSKDYEYRLASAEAMLRLAMTGLMLHRLAPHTS